MKHLNRVLLISWLHYQKELVDMKTINFFAGNNGAGKSAFIDALQVVLLGETHRKNFNQAANDRSARTLEGYLRAERGDNSPNSRRGKDFCSYLVCEFYDDQKKDHFVLGVAFECYKNDDIIRRFFGYQGEIPEHCFLKDKIAMDLDSLRQFLKDSGDKDYLYTEKATAYRDYLMARINVYDPKFFSLLKKSIALKQVTKIEDFITENICDAMEPLDIGLMQENIRNYKDQEALAKREGEKLEALQEISQIFAQWETSLQNLKQHEFLVLWGEREKIQEELQEAEGLFAKFQEETQELEAEIQKTGALRQEKESQRDALKYKRDNDDAVKEKKRLDSLYFSLQQREKELESLLNHCLQELNQEKNQVLALCQAVSSQGDLFPQLQEGALAVSQVYTPLSTENMEIFPSSLDVFQEIQEKTSGFSLVLRETAMETRQQLKRYQQDLAEKEATMENLKKNIKTYPKELISLQTQLKQGLQQGKTPCEVEILADVLEITPGEEAWRPVVEAYLNNQKFYLLLPPEQYSQGLTLFQQWKESQGIGSFGLVDLKKLREKGKKQPEPGSLAEKLQTNNPLARDYVDFLLGSVMCCETKEEMRQHRQAVSQDGFVYQGFVLRNYPKKLLNSAYIGQKAVELQLKQLTEQVETLKQEYESLEQGFSVFRGESQRDWLISGRFLGHELVERRENHLELGKNRLEQEKTQEAMAQCNLYWLVELEGQIEILSQEIQSLMEQRDGFLHKSGELKTKLAQLDRETIPSLRRVLGEKQGEIQSTISEEYAEKVGLPRYQQELARLGSARQIVANFQQQVQRQGTITHNLRRDLLDTRQKYSHRFQPCPFQIDAEDNQEFEKEQKLLEESKLPAYAQKIQEARDSAMEQFQNEFLDKLKSSIDQVHRQVTALNKALQGAHFGNHSYQFKIEKNPNYSEYYAMIMSDKRMDGAIGLERLAFQQEFASLQEELFSRLAVSEEHLTGRKVSELEENIRIFTDFRTYLKFDMESKDKNGVKQLLSKVLATNSGGETQTPFYIAMLASYAQLYKVNQSTTAGNTIRLVIFDEAFSKMDSDRIIECIRLLRTLNLQAIMSTPPEKVPDIMPEVDQTLLFSHENNQMRTRSFQSTDLGKDQSEGG